MTLDDTSAAMRSAYYARLAELSPGERVQIGLRLWEAANSLQRAAVLRENPDASEAEILYQIAASRFGEAVAQAAYRKS
jgi:hypothetical protein